MTTLLDELIRAGCGDSFGKCKFPACEPGTIACGPAVRARRLITRLVAELRNPSEETIQAYARSTDVSAREIETLTVRIKIENKWLANYLSDQVKQGGGE